MSVYEIVQQLVVCLEKGSEPIVPQIMGIRASRVLETYWIKLEFKKKSC